MAANSVGVERWRKQSVAPGNAKFLIRYVDPTGSRSSRYSLSSIALVLGGAIFYDTNLGALHSPSNVGYVKVQLREPPQAP
jgi:hypothetical protein